MSLEAMECRSCAKRGLEQVLDFGMAPLSDQLLRKEDLHKPDLLFPLELVLCPYCSLLQLTEAVDPEILYRSDYHYFTSVSSQLVRHFADGAKELMADQTISLGPRSLVVEIASNDGSALRPFADAGIPVLGIDPAESPAEAARAVGVETRVEFFTRQNAAALAQSGRRADVILGNNVLNLIPDLRDFAEALRMLLKEDGTVVLEAPYALPLIQDALFDNIFHQNMGYFSLTAIDRLFRQFGFKVTRVDKIPTFGGSLRVRLRRRGPTEESVYEMLRHEEKVGIDNPAFYRDFGDRTRNKAVGLKNLVDRLVAEGKRLAVYGAAGGMATTLLSYLNLNSSQVDFAVDANPHKHGLYTSGSRLLVSPPERLLTDRPDYVVLLAWNFEKEVVSQQEEYLRGGGRFIVPLPEPVVVGWLERRLLNLQEIGSESLMAVQ